MHLNTESSRLLHPGPGHVLRGSRETFASLTQQYYNLRMEGLWRAQAVDVLRQQTGAEALGEADIVIQFPLLSGWRAALRRRWHDQSVRRQLMISISIISISAVLLSILLAVLDARGRVEVEVNSSMELAQQLVRDMVKRLAAEAQMERAVQRRCPSSSSMCATRASWSTDAQGDLVQIAPDETAERNSSRAPRARAALVHRSRRPERRHARSARDARATTRSAPSSSSASRATSWARCGRRSRAAP